MNKYIRHSCANSPSRRQRLHRSQQAPCPIDNHQQSYNPSRKTSQNYLESQMPSAQLIRSCNKSKDIKGYRPAIIVRQAMQLADRRFDYRRRIKRLVIQDKSDGEYRANSLSIALDKKKTESCEPKIYSFSSEKKTSLNGGFQVSSPPKRQSSKIIQEKKKEEEIKCHLIRSILKKYKDQQNTAEPHGDGGSPSISSLKLKERLELGRIKGKDHEQLKFIGHRGCPPNKLAQQYIARRERLQVQPYKGSVLQDESRNVQISPWGTD